MKTALEYFLAVLVIFLLAVIIIIITSGAEGSIKSTPEPTVTCATVYVAPDKPSFEIKSPAVEFPYLIAKVC